MPDKVKADWSAFLDQHRDWTLPERSKNLRACKASSCRRWLRKQSSRTTESGVWADDEPRAAATARKQAYRRAHQDEAGPDEIERAIGQSSGAADDLGRAARMSELLKASWMRIAPVSLLVCSLGRVA